VDKQLSQQSISVSMPCERLQRQYRTHHPCTAGRAKGPNQKPQHPQDSWPLDTPTLVHRPTAKGGCLAGGACLLADARTLCQLTRPVSTSLCFGRHPAFWQTSC
jgi:hypothetical protein